MDRNRRLFLAAASSTLAGTMLPQITSAAAPQPVALQAASAPGGLAHYIAVVEVEGELRLNPDGKKVTTRPMKVVANLEFDQKVLPASPGKVAQLVRHYNKAQADIQVERTKVKNELREDVRTMCLAIGKDSATLYSPLGPLTRDEIDLLRIPGEPAMWNGLLPEKPVKTGDTWKPADATLAMLLGIDVVTANDIRAKFVKLDGAMAMMELEGHVTGAVGGIATDFDLRAKYNLDARRKYVTWLALGFKEKRAIGHAAPGYDATGRVRISAAPLSASTMLADDLLKEFSLELDAGSTLLTHDSHEGGFQLIHDRRWHIMTDQRDATVLRLIDGGDLIAQCNISRLRDLPEGKQLALEAYQEEVAKALGNSAQQVVDANQSTTDSGLRQLRIVVAGAVQEVPVQWTYYHLADEKGRNATLVFTMDARLVERFAELDRSMVSSIQLRSRSIDAAATTETASEENPQEAPQEAPVEQAQQPAETTKK